jgi:hypothetical protein
MVLNQWFSKGVTGSRDFLLMVLLLVSVSNKVNMQEYVRPNDFESQK